MLLNVNPPARRGAVFSLLNLCNDLGRGLGAWAVGMMAASLGRTTAFHIAFLFWVPAGLLLWSLSAAFPREQEAVQSALRALAQARCAQAQSPAAAVENAAQSAT